MSKPFEQSAKSNLRVRQRLGKYRIQRRLAQGGFANVFEAYDTIEGVSVALKVPHPGLVTSSTLDSFRREVRMIASLDHPNILALKTAEVIDGHFVIVTALGSESLSDRMARRMSRDTVLGYTDQIIEALACAHRSRIIHCDVKPENLILFPDHRLRLADFGLARVVSRTIVASGSGTIGYMAPEQALGKPSFRSDVFSAGLLIWRMMSGALPEWPFRWPLEGAAKLRESYHADVVTFLRKALEVDEKRRFTDCDRMLASWKRIRTRAKSRSAIRRKTR